MEIKFYVIFNLNVNSFLNDKGHTVNLPFATRYKNTNECQIVVNNWKLNNPNIKDWTFEAVEFTSTNNIRLI